MNKNMATQSPEVADPSQAPRDFRRALSQYATGVTIVTASNGSRHVGVTANSFSSVSLDPPLVLWSIDRKSTSMETFLEASHFAINILSNSQADLSTKFSRTSEEKFIGVQWTAGSGGAPLIDGSVVQLECRREFEYEGGDHLIMVGRVERYSRYELEPLIFSKGRYAIAVESPMSDATSAEKKTSVQGDAIDEPTLLQSLLRAYDGISAKFHTHRHEEGLTLNQSRALALLAKGRAESIAQIMTGALLGQGAAEDSINNLLERNFAAQDKFGGYEITQLGRETSVRLKQKLRDVEMQVISRIPGFDMAASGRLIGDLAKAAQE